MIACVDPDPDARRALCDVLADAGFDVRESGSLSDALADLGGDQEVECVVTEQDLPDGTGLELVERVRERAPDAVCILFTHVPLEAIDTAAFGDAVVEYLSKSDPDARSRLVDLVRDGVALRSQTAYPLPENETARVEALERYAPDPGVLGDSIDRLTEIATGLFDVNSAAVGLIDAHEERFLSCYGAAFETMDRQETVCTYTILDAGVTVVEDVRADPRFSDNEGLSDAGIRFYAGAPLVTPEGHPIGVFCVHDGDPRTFSERDREYLVMLAEEAMDHLESQRRLREATEDADGG